MLNDKTRYYWVGQFSFVFRFSLSPPDPLPSFLPKHYPLNYTYTKLSKLSEFLTKATKKGKEKKGTPHELRCQGPHDKTLWSGGFDRLVFYLFGRFRTSCLPLGVGTRGSTTPFMYCMRMARGIHKWNWRLGATFPTLASATDACFFFLSAFDHPFRTGGGVFFRCRYLICFPNPTAVHIHQRRLTFHFQLSFSTKNVSSVIFLLFFSEFSSVSVQQQVPAIPANTHKSYHGRTVCSHCL